VETIGARIKSIRESLEFTQSSFGSLFGKSQAQMSAYEKDINWPDFPFLSEIQKKFNINPAYFFGTEETIQYSHSSLSFLPLFSSQNPKNLELDSKTLENLNLLSKIKSATHYHVFSKKVGDCFEIGDVAFFQEANLFPLYELQDGQIYIIQKVKYEPTQKIGLEKEDGVLFVQAFILLGNNKEIQIKELMTSRVEQVLFNNIYFYAKLVSKISSGC